MAFILINGTNQEGSQEEKDYLENLLKRINELERQIKVLSEEIKKTKYYFDKTNKNFEEYKYHHQ